MPPTQVSSTPPALEFVNSGNATVTPSTISYSIIRPVNVTPRTIQLRQTGQTTIYTTYDDGCEITEHLTKLIWLKNSASAGATNLTWDDSLTTANNYNIGGKTIPHGAYQMLMNYSAS